jgi:isopropylmalate/homocitrate/citramalate synthase
MSSLRGQDAIGTLTGATPLNFAPELREQMDLPARIVLNDITLREGRQFEGTILTTDECVKIAEILVHDLNMPMIQMGGYKPRDRAFMTAVRKFLDTCGRKVRTEAMTSAHQNSPDFSVKQLLGTLDIIADSGFGTVLCIASSDTFLRACAEHRGDSNMSKDDLRKQEIETALNAIRYAREKGIPEVNVNFQDFLRADLEFLKEFSKIVGEAGADTIILDDFGGGIGLPILYKEIFRAVRRATPTKTGLGIHAHDHAGMAVATALASVEGGCEMITVGVNGYGEGTGHVPLAETVYHLEMLYGFDTGINLENLRPASVMISDIMKHPLSKIAPLVGDDAFVVMHDKHHQYPEYPFMFVPMKPEMVGNKGRVGFSEWAGPFGLRLHAKALGETIPDGKIAPMLDALTNEMQWRKRALTDDEFRGLLHHVREQASAA